MTHTTSNIFLLLLPILTQSCSIKSGANCWKHDIPNGKQPHTMTVGECCATCTNTTLCKAFTLDIDTSQSGSDNASLGICYLKYSCGKQLLLCSFDPYNTQLPLPRTNFLFSYSSFSDFSSYSSLKFIFLLLTLSFIVSIYL